MSAPLPSTDVPTDTNAPQNTATGTDYALTATNNSTVPGTQYFNIYPLPLKSIPAQNQFYTARVSPPTSRQDATVHMNWHVDQTAITVLAMSSHAEISQAVKLTAPLGSTVTLDWQDGAYQLAISASDTGTAIIVNVSAAVPANSLVGLDTGLTPIFVNTTGAGALSLEPDLTPSAVARFGTAYQWASSDISEGSGCYQVIFYPTGETSAYAQIQIGMDNVITQTA